MTVAAEKTVRTPGEFYQYARKYLNADPILTPSVSWKVTDAVIVPTAVADTGEQYLVTLKGGNGTYIMVSDQGFPVSINDAEYDGAPEAVVLPRLARPSRQYSRAPRPVRP